MQGGSLYHFYDGLWYHPAGTRTCDLPCERHQPDTVFTKVCLEIWIFKINAEGCITFRFTRADKDDPINLMALTQCCWWVSRLCKGLFRPDASASIWRRKHNALILEHMLVNLCIQTGCDASQFLYNRDAVVLTLARPVWIDPNSIR